MRKFRAPARYFFYSHSEACACTWNACRAVDDSWTTIPCVSACFGLIVKEKKRVGAQNFRTLQLFYSSRAGMTAKGYTPAKPTHSDCERVRAVGPRARARARALAEFWPPQPGPFLSCFLFWVLFAAPSPVVLQQKIRVCVVIAFVAAPPVTKRSSQSNEGIQCGDGISQMGVALIVIS